MFTNKRLGRAASIAAVAALVVWVGVDLLGRGLLGDVPWLESLVDFRLLYDFSRHVVERHDYPPKYPYPPSAVVFHAAASSLPFAASAVLWTALCWAAAVGCWVALARLLRLDFDAGAYLLLPVAHLSCAYFFQWDLRSANCNLIFLGALILAADALQRERWRAAGFWLALAFSLKLFCVLVIPYLLWKGHRRAFAWTLAFVAVFWLLLPALVFGEGVTSVYAGWFAQMRHAASYAPGDCHPILTSLPRAAAWLLGERAPLIVNGVRGLWLVLGFLGWLASARRSQRDGAFGLLADVALLTLAPVAVSPYLEPYHPVACAIPALLLLYASADGTQPERTRWLALAAFVASLAVMKLPLPWEARGLLINAKLLLSCGGATAVAALRASAELRPWPAAHVAGRLLALVKAGRMRAEENCYDRVDA